jgi:histidinol-phosphate phosphatase family protein
MKRKVIFFDRDNTLIIDKNYMHDPADLKFYDDSFSALKIMKNKGYEFIIITNQSGVGRGIFSIAQMHQFNSAMIEEFKKQDIEFIDLKFCPHSPEDGCDCRKPSPKMINECLTTFDIDLEKSYMIGDKVIDAQCGEAAGLNGVTLNCKKISDFKDFSSLTQFAHSL